MKTIKFTALLLAITAMVSCQKENIDTTYNSDPLAVKLTATVGSPFTRSNPLADGTASATFKSGDQIAVAAGTQGEVKYTLNGTSWTPESGKYHKWESDPMDFTAYYPVAVNNASATTFATPEVQNTLPLLEQADYMTFSGSFAKPANLDNVVSFSLTRQMARVIVSTTFNDQYATGYTVESIKVQGNTSGYASGSAKSGNINVDTYKQEGKFYALLSPTTAAPAITFLTITVKKTDDGNTQELTVKGIPAMEAGKSYTYNVKVGKDNVAITSITVNDWTTGEAIPDGETDAVTKTYLDATFATALADVAPNIMLKDDNDGKGKYLNLADNAVMAAVKAITELDVSGRSITSLKGIEQFTGLTKLNCSVNLLTTLDVSKLTNLMYLSCDNNSLIALYVSNQPKLIKLLCSYNNLTTLDVSKQTKMQQLDCFKNNLTTLDISMFILDLYITLIVRCGDQKDNRELRFIMTQPMYQVHWMRSWKDLQFNNRVIPVDPSGTPY